MDSIRGTFFLRRGIFLGGYGLKYKERGFLLNKTTTKNLAESKRMTTSALLESTLYITVSARSNG